jgi:hypothetical protein
MTATRTRNMSASVLARLLDRAKRTGDDYLRYLAERFEFDRGTLVEAVRRTFARRQTPVPEAAPIGLTTEYWNNPSRPVQVRAFARRAGLEVTGTPVKRF